MNLNLDTNGFRSIANSFDLFFIDIWGVIHNGISIFEDSINVLDELDKLNKEYVLLTNAPRPNDTVKNFLIKMGLEKIKSEKVYTSGEAALENLSLKWKDKKFFHIGPPRDFDLFKLFEKNKVDNIADAEFLLCTGLFEKYEVELDYYKSLLKNITDIKMICTNPDLVVDRGEVREYCAGSVAKIFEDLGGFVDYFGKPYPEIYNFCIKKSERVLAIGDNIRTDIKGANIMKFDSLFITEGIHKKEFINLPIEKYDNVLKKYNVETNYYQKGLIW